MYNNYRTYPCPYYANTAIYNPNIMYNPYQIYPCPYCIDQAMYNSDFSNQSLNEYIPFDSTNKNELTRDEPPCDFLECARGNERVTLNDQGPNPFVIDIQEATEQNENFRTTLWTGEHLQLTLMSIDVGEDIGLEVHPELDQFIRIEDGKGLVTMGDRADNLTFEQLVEDDFIVIIPAGTWHNLINTGDEPIKLYSIYTPPEHPHGTVHKTKAEAEAAEEH